MIPSNPGSWEIEFDKYALAKLLGKQAFVEVKLFRAGPKQIAHRENVTIDQKPYESMENYDFHWPILRAGSTGQKTSSGISQ